MIFELEGYQASTGKWMKAKVEAATLEAAIERATRHGLTIDTNLSSPDTDSPAPQSPPEEGAPNSVAAVGSPGAPSHLGEPISRFWKSVFAAGGVVVLGMIVLAAVVANSAQESRTAQPPPPITRTSEVWTPPTELPTRVLPPHVVRSNAGDAVPEPGYLWTSGDKLAVQWAKGLRHPAFPNISSAEREGYWVPDAGYEFTSTDSLKVTWTPGRPHPDRAHIVAGVPEGNWVPAVGYVWTRPKDPLSFDVLWSSGVPHPAAPHVLTGTTEGTYEPAQGYTWLNNTPGDYSVVEITSTENASSSTKAGPTDEQIQSAIGKIIVAALAEKAASNNSGDTLVAAIGRQLAINLRDEAIKSAMGDLFPGESTAAINAASNLIILGIDGRMTADNWNSANARDELAARLRAADPSIANSYQVAEFIGNVLDGYNRRQ